MRLTTQFVVRKCLFEFDGSTRTRKEIQIYTEITLYFRFWFSLQRTMVSCNEIDGNREKRMKERNIAKSRCRESGNTAFALFRLY